MKVSFKGEDGEGSGVARSFFTAISNAFLADEKLPNLDNLTVSSREGISQFLYFVLMEILFYLIKTCSTEPKLSFDRLANNVYKRLKCHVNFRNLLIFLSGSVI